MPTYNFHCPNHPEQEIEVVHTFESLRRNTWLGTVQLDPPVPACPVCDTDMRRKFTAPAVHFKGSGWGSKP